MAKSNIQRFFKEQIVNSKLFRQIELDILKVILEDFKEYSVEECQKKIDEFNSREVD